MADSNRIAEALRDPIREMLDQADAVERWKGAMTPEIIDPRRIEEITESVRQSADPMRKAMELGSSPLGHLQHLDDIAATARQLDEPMRLMREAAQGSLPPDLALEAKAGWPGLEDSGIQVLKDHLHEASAQAAQVAEILRFQPSYLELEAMAARTRELWAPLIASADAGFALASFSSLAKAIDFDPFSDATTAALRSQLGDWSAFPPERTVDQTERQAVYAEHGLDQRLVALPSATFDLTLTVTGIRADESIGYTPPDLDRELLPGPSGTPGEDSGLLQLFESKFRAFIEATMTSAYGPQWAKQRVTRDVLGRWRQRRKERIDEDPGRRVVEPLLSFADFMDYPEIICRADNWPLFAPYFRSQNEIRAMFHILGPIRKDIGHSRTLTKADRLYFHTAIHRLWVATQRDPTEPSQEDDE